MAVSPAVGPRI